MFWCVWLQGNGEIWRTEQDTKGGILLPDMPGEGAPLVPLQTGLAADVAPHTWVLTWC